MAVTPPTAPIPEDLAEIIARMLAGRGIDVPASALRIARSAHASSCSLYEVDADDRPDVPPMLLKDLSLVSRVPEAAGIRPAHLYDPLREIAVYQRILAPAGIGVGYHGGAFDRRSGRSLLLLERVDAMALDYIGEFDAWLRAARSIGAMQRFLPERAIDSKARRHLVDVNGADLAFWIARAASTTPALDVIAADGPRLCAAFAALPRTFAHGELFASNILVDDERVLPVDWELASIAPGAIDIAALGSGGWSDDERGALVSAWRDGLGVSDDDDAPLARGATDRAVDLARLYVAVRLIGWSTRWTPPADEQHDWLGEALGAHSRLTRA